MQAPLPTLVDGRAIALLQDEQTVRWHEHPPQAPAADGTAPLDELLDRVHRANFLLWHAEDEARLPAAEDGTVAAAKRQIDRINQQRNDAVEGIDKLLLRALGDMALGTDAAQHSETPGMMIDRLSILSLKLFHTREEVAREHAPPGHRERNLDRLATLLQQREDLVHCLNEVWAQVCAGRRYFKLYRQLKMYNDPELNPMLYRGRTRAESAETTRRP